MKVLVAVFCAVVGLLLTQPVGHARTALFMSGTQTCFTDPGDCRPTVTPSRGEMAGILPELFVGDTLVGVATPGQFRPFTGATSLTWDQSVAGGLDSLKTRLAATAGPKVVVGQSQSATVVAELKREYVGNPTSAPEPSELSFVVLGNPNRAHTGVAAQYPGVSIPFLGLTSTGPAPDTPYDTIDVAREYDPVADFPQRPLNLIATANAVAGFFYIHPNYGGIKLADVPEENVSEVKNSTGGTTTYYLVPTPELPLLRPLRDLGVPASIVDPLNAALKPIVDAGYNRKPYRSADPDARDVADAADSSDEPETSRTAGTPSIKALSERSSARQSEDPARGSTSARTQRTDTDTDTDADPHAQTDTDTDNGTDADAGNDGSGDAA